MDLQGLTLAKRLSLFLKVTLSDLKPFPIGVSKGPLSPYLYFLTASILSFDIRSPCAVWPLVWIS